MANLIKLQRLNVVKIVDSELKAEQLKEKGFEVVKGKKGEKQESGK